MGNPDGAQQAMPEPGWHQQPYSRLVWHWHDPPQKWGVSTASPPKPMMTHHLKLIRRKGEKRSKERAMRVERNSATGRPKPRQEERQRAMRQSRLGTVQNLISLSLSLSLSLYPLTPLTPVCMHPSTPIALVSAQTITRS